MPLVSHMSNYVRIGRDIIVGKGWSAKHWAGPVIFGRDAIYICPNASQPALMAGIDSGASAMFGAVGGAVGAALAGAVLKKGEAQSGWQSQVVDLGDLPSDVLNGPDWPLRDSHRPVIVLKRESIEKIERAGGKFLVAAHGDTFKLGMKLFGRGKVVETVRGLGWQV